MSSSKWNSYTHMRAHTDAHARTRAHTHTHTHTPAYLLGKCKALGQVSFWVAIYLAKSAGRKAQISNALVQLREMICALLSADFHPDYHPEPPDIHSLFLFPITFRITLIHFFDGKNNLGQGRHYYSINCHWPSITIA